MFTQKRETAGGYNFTASSHQKPGEMSPKYSSRNTSATSRGGQLHATTFENKVEVCQTSYEATGETSEEPSLNFLTSTSNQKMEARQHREQDSFTRWKKRRASQLPQGATRSKTCNSVQIVKIITFFNNKQKLLGYMTKEIRKHKRLKAMDDL